MIWHEKLFTGPSLRETAEDLIGRITSCTYEGRAWLILLPVTDRNQLQVLSLSSARTWYPNSFSKKKSEDSLSESCDPVIVGIAGSRAEAEDLLVRMTEEALRLFGTATPRRIFEKLTDAAMKEM